MKTAEWKKRQFRFRKALAGTWLHSFFGNRIFHSKLWRVDLRSVSGGLALGIFIACTPTFPFQMFLAICGAIMFHVNLPLALAACWVTNPLTMVPYYAAAWKLGKSMIDHSELLQSILEFYPHDEKALRFIRQSINLWSGSLVIAVAASLLTYVTVRLFWVSIRKLLVHEKSG
ncbi:MAG: DUF2062 domain-containing protein [Candidatus Wallbacteria bacterium]|nr:DUF2062 domain-containing protein [Candidatus Wallbacteria bacterium]